MKTDIFANRHNGPSPKDIELMLKKIGVGSVDELINQIIPDNIRLKKPLKVAPAVSEFQYLKNLRKLASKNKVFRSYIGLGYSGTIVPPVVQRNVLENPGWYTAYTPYQAEIAQGRLEALLNFQTMVIDLTGMPIANASLLDEATAAAEAMAMLFSSRTKEAQTKGANVFFVAANTFPQTIDVVKTRATPLGIEVVVGAPIAIGGKTFSFTDKIFGALIQYPNMDGQVNDYKEFVNRAHANGTAVAVATDLLALALLTPPGEWGADVVFGNSQRFGVPMGYGGPHAAFFAAKEDYKRLFPGRIIGVSVDSHGNPALRMALQTREQHIRREKATSNICTAQALLAIMASMYAVYHGQEGIKGIAQQVHANTVHIANELKNLGYEIENSLYFDTLKVKMPQGVHTTKVKELAQKFEINFRYIDDATVTLALDQTVDTEDILDLLTVFATAKGTAPNSRTESAEKSIIETSSLKRTSSYLTHPIFNSYHSESEMMRYIKRLENKDLSLTHSMIALGSCTMKLNAAAELLPLTWPEWANIHPFAPVEQAKGYALMIKELDKDLSNITGFDAMSFQPNSGASGEYAGLLVIRAYHHSRGDTHRNVALIPQSAHGTNPASAAMAGMNIIIVKCDDKGNIDIKDLEEKAVTHKQNLSCLMVTYPSTHGVYEDGIRKITKIIHDNGGQVYMDGANMNAQVGLTSPGNIGADVCHLNLHKTFAIPHGGGGPGMGPIGVAKHLTPFLPAHWHSPSPTLPEGKGVLSPSGRVREGLSVSSAPYGSALILLISYGYIKMLGGEGCTEATRMAILNANYMKEVLQAHYPILYTGNNGRVAHEMILDCKELKRVSGIEVGDIAKRLMDYGFHAPTVSFPVHDTLMVEPTESEAKAELDRFCDAMISIKNEIMEIAEGKADVTDNVIKNAPHTVKSVVTSDWNHKYTREKAVYPLKWVKDNKFWPSVGRVDNAAGDRNLICACPPIEAYLPAIAQLPV